MFCGQPAGDALELLRPALETTRSTGEPDSLLNTVATCRAHPRRRARRRLRELHGAHRPRPPARLADRARSWQLPARHGARARRSRPGGRGRRSPVLRVQAAPQPPPALLWSLYPLVDALTELDEPDERRHRARGVGPRRPAGGRAGLTAVAAEPRAAAARPAPARRRPRRSRGAAARWGEFGILHPGLASWRVDAAEALVALGDPAEARRHAERAPRARRAPRPPRPARRRPAALARTADRDERIALLERAVTLLADSPAQLEHARALVDLGAALRRANRRADARAPLRQALDLAERGGMRLLARRARDELQRRRRPPAPRRAHRPARADRRRAPRRALRRRRPLQPRDRRAALRHPAHRRDAPHARLPEARHPALAPSSPPP